VKKGFFSANELQSKKTPSTQGCGLCKLNKTCNSPKMEWTGDGEKKVLIVDEVPGEKEDKK